VIRRIDIPPDAVVFIHSASKSQLPRDHWFCIECRKPPNIMELRTSGVIYDREAVDKIAAAADARDWKTVFAVAATRSQIYNLNQWPKSGLNLTAAFHNTHIEDGILYYRPVRPVPDPTPRPPRRPRIGAWTSFSEAVRRIREIMGVELTVELTVARHRAALEDAGVLKVMWRGKARRCRIISTDKTKIQAAIDSAPALPDPELQKAALRRIEKSIAGIRADPQGDLACATAEILSSRPSVCDPVFHPPVDVPSLDRYEAAHWPEIRPGTAHWFLDGEPQRGY
jgi:hypothetical protein